MTDERDEIQPQDAPVTIERKARISPDAPRLITAAAIGAAVGAAVTHVMESMDFFDFGRSGDEAPIRVKGGSVHCEVLSDTLHWEEDGSPKNWKLSDGKRRSESLVVIVGISDANDDTHSRTYITERMRVNYAAQAFIQFTGKDYHMKVVAHDNLKRHSNDRRLLRLERAIDSIVLKDHGEVYRSGAGTLDYVLILDECWQKR